MLNYMGAELYKLLRRKYLYIFTLVILAGEALLVSSWVFTNSRGNHIHFHDGAVMADSFLVLGLYLAVVIAEAVFSDQYKHGTLKNEVSFGIPRARIFLGKLFVELLLGVVLLAVFMAFYVGLCWLTLLKSTPEEVQRLFLILRFVLLAALPQYVGMVCVCHTAYFLLRSEIWAGVGFVLVLFVPQNFLYIFGSIFSQPWMLRLYGLMPSALVDGARTVVGDWSYVATSWGMGAFWAAASIVIGLLLFRKKEIN